MRFYYFMMRRYNNSWHQLKCLALYLPFFVAAYITAGFTKQRFPLLYHLFLLLLGWLTATFLEYIIHRFWMHDSKERSSSLSAYHSYHHTHPSEIKITAGLRIIFVLVGIGMLYLCFRLQNVFTLIGGLYLGFCTYALMHKAIHQKWSAKIFPKLTRFHIYHHCKFPNTCFGVSVTWWDEIFGTVPPKQVTLSKRIIDFYLHGHRH